MKKIFAALLVIGSLAGCATPPTNFSVSVNTLVRPDAPHNLPRFIVAPAENTVPSSDLQFIEFSNYVKTALIRRGYIFAEQGTPIDLIVLLSYSIGEPKQQQQIYSTPVFGQTGVSSASTYGAVIGNSYYGTTTYTPTYGITGTSTDVNTFYTYSRLIKIVGYEVKEKPADYVVAWQTMISSTGTSNDLRRVFPYMIAGASPYLGVNTVKTITVSLPESQKSLAIFAPPKDPPDKK